MAYSKEKFQAISELEEGKESYMDKTLERAQRANNAFERLGANWEAVKSTLRWAGTYYRKLYQELEMRREADALNDEHKRLVSKAEDARNGFESALQELENFEKEKLGK